MQHVIWRQCLSCNRVDGADGALTQRAQFLPPTQGGRDESTSRITVELCACARARGPSRGTYIETLLQTLPKAVATDTRSEEGRRGLGIGMPLHGGADLVERGPLLPPRHQRVRRDRPTRRHRGHAGPREHAVAHAQQPGQRRGRRGHGVAACAKASHGRGGERKGAAGALPASQGKPQARW
jgi:hypothetical protein